MIKLSLPATAETMSGVKPHGSCAGVYFRAQSMGGTIYAFLDRLKGVKIKVRGCCWWKFWEWKIKRKWKRMVGRPKTNGDIFQWSSPLTWTRADVTCYPSSQDEGKSG